MSGAAPDTEVIYLDNNATTRIAPEVLEAMMPFLTTEYYNPSSVYERAAPAANAVKAARKTIAQFLGGVSPHEIMFNSCATEGANTAILGAVKANPERRHIISTSVEHPAVYEVCKNLEREGMDVSFLPVDRAGRVQTRDFIEELRSDTLLVAAMHANNETGVVYPVGEYARIAKETDRQILVFVDATQTAGKLPLDLGGELANVDMLAFSGHKIHAPKGIGAMFVRRGTRVRPYIAGGHQESGRRAGTENVPYIVGLARAVELAAERHDEDEPRIRAMRDRLERGLLASIPCIEVNGAGAERLPNTLNVSVHFIEGEGMLYQLNEHGICASSGSACTSGSLEPSHVLKAMNIPFTAMHGSIRFSFSRYNSDSDVDRVLEVFPGIVASLRRLSPYWDQKANRPRPEAEAMMGDACPPGE